MEIETFDHKEVSADGSEIKDFEIFKQVKESDFDGQEDLFVEKDGEVTAFPFAPMSDTEEQVYEAILPESTSVDRFSEELVPLRVMEIYERFSSLFSSVKIWTREKEAIEDPVMVGRVKSWDSDLNHDAPGGRYLLARWGKELMPFEQIKKKAIEKRKSQILSQIEPIKQMLQAKKEAVEEITHWDGDILEPIDHDGLNIWDDTNIF